MINAFTVHLGETCRITLTRTPLTVIPAIFFCILLVTAAFQIGPDLTFASTAPGLVLGTGGGDQAGAGPALTPRDYLVGVMAVSAAALAAFLAAARLMEDLRRTRLLAEVLAAPLAGWLPALAWLLPATLAGLLAGTVVRLLAAGLGGLPFGPLELLPLLAAAALFASLGLLLWVFLSPSWLEGARLYLLPLLVLFAAVVPWGEEHLAQLALINPLHHGARILQFIMLGPARWESLLADDQVVLMVVVSGAVALALPVGIWLLTLALCHQGVGIRTKD